MHGPHVGPRFRHVRIEIHTAMKRLQCFVPLRELHTCDALEVPRFIDKGLHCQGITHVRVAAMEVTLVEAHVRPGAFRASVSTLRQRPSSFVILDILCQISENRHEIRSFPVQLQLLTHDHFRSLRLLKELVALDDFIPQFDLPEQM